MKRTAFYYIRKTLGIKRSTLNKWVDGTNRVPAHKALLLEAVTGIHHDRFLFGNPWPEVKSLDVVKLNLDDHNLTAPAQQKKDNKNV